MSDESSMICPRCGADDPEPAAYCTACGHGWLRLYKIKFKIEGHKVKKPFCVYAHSPGEAYMRAARCIPHWIAARGWVPGMLTKELLQ